MRRSAWTTGVAAIAALSLGVAACGGGDSNSEDKPADGTKPSTTAKTGGKLTALWTGDVDFIDCGRTFYQPGAQICNATQKSLYSYKPDDAVTLVPDMAATAPEISEDGQTVTVKLKQGVKYSPPYNKEVTSADIKYAIERGFFSSVTSGFTVSYYIDLEGAKIGVKPGTKISGITTPDKYTVVFKFKRPVGGIMAAGALGSTATAPVPEAYAKEFDQEAQTTYGEHQLATGPYMIENDASGATIGYEPGKRIHLVRNPNWDKKLDFKPAYLDEIDNVQGNDDTGVASRRILDGKNMTTGDFSPPPENLKDAFTNRKDQLHLTPSGGGRWVAMNTTVKPFDDINVRKAVSAGFDREALRLARGGATIGDIATHWLPPGIAGFEEAGGVKGPGVDFLSPDGKPNMELAAEYFKKAGYASGKYEGTEKILMVGSNAGVAAKVAEVSKENFEKLGFQVQMRLVQQNTMYTRYCNLPSAKVAVCPNVGWGRDFADGHAYLSAVFNGKNIHPESNSNWSQQDDPAINKAMDKAELLPTAERAAGWAAIDKTLTEQALAVPYVWDKTTELQSDNVNGVVATYNGGLFDLAWTSLK